MRSWVPIQSQAAELLDGALPDRRLLRANLREMALADRWLGGQRAIIRRIAAWLQLIPRDAIVRVLDVATGGADLPLALHRWGTRRGRTLHVLASDVSGDVLRVAREEISSRPVTLVCHDALHMPFADCSIDVVTCTQSLHHFKPQAVAQLLHEMARIARIGVIVTDLRRSYLAYWGARLLAFGPVSSLSRHDGPLSVLRAYTPEEIKKVVQHIALPVTVQGTAGFRIEVALRKEERQTQSV